MRLVIVNTFTLFRIAAAVVIAVWCWPQGAWGITLGLMVTAFLTDIADGLLARRWRVVSTFGKIVDPLADKAICLVMLWLIAGLYAWPYTIVAIIITTYDITTMSLRLFTKSSTQAVSGASIIAKIKTAVLMLGLTVSMISIATDTRGILPILGFVLLSVACVLSGRSLVHYLRRTREAYRTTGAEA